MAVGIGWVSVGSTAGCRGMLRVSVGCHGARVRVRVRVMDTVRDRGTVRFSRELSGSHGKWRGLVGSHMGPRGMPRDPWEFMGTLPRETSMGPHEIPMGLGSGFSRDHTGTCGSKKRRNSRDHAGTNGKPYHPHVGTCAHIHNALWYYHVGQRVRWDPVVLYGRHSLREFNGMSIMFK